MKTKLTAVEWLIDQVEQFHCLLPVDIIEQALAMEKEQIMEAFNAGQANTATEPFWTKGNYYYEQKYVKRNAPSDEGIDQPGLP